MEWKYKLSCKEKFQAQRSVKKVMLTIYWEMKGTITIDILEKVKRQTMLPIAFFLSNISPYLLNDLAY